MTMVFEEAENGVTTLTLNRPDKRNALSDDILGALADALDRACVDPACRAIVITGAGGVFAAGADIARFQSFDAVSVRHDTRPLLWQRVSSCRKPMIAAVEGWCLGAGAELALMCDIIVAGGEAQFGLPEVGLGIMPGAGGTQRLPRSVSKSDAMLLVLAAERVTAQEALAMRLISRLCETGAALATAQAIAERIARQAPVAVENAKAAVLRSYATPLGAGLQSERDLYVQTFSTEDRTEGVAAFLEKRRPRFHGK